MMAGRLITRDKLLAYLKVCSPDLKDLFSMVAWIQDAELRLWFNQVWCIVSQMLLIC